MRTKVSRKVRPGRVTLVEAAERDRVIVSVATEEFLARGFEKTTIDDIAAKSRVSRTTIYSLFGSKEGLFSHICTESIAQQNYELGEALAMNRPFKDVIRRAVEIMLKTTETYKSSFLALAVDARDSFPSIGRMMMGHAFRSIAPLGKYLRSKAKSGTLTDHSALILAYHLMSMTCGGFSAVIIRPRELYEDREEWISLIVELFTEGFPLA